MRPITSFFLLLLLSIFVSIPLAAKGNGQAPDTVVNTLQEVTVQGNSQILKTNSTTYYPSSNAKKSATDAINLLQRMAMSEVRIDPVSKKLFTADGGEVALFINFLPATEADIQGLNSSEVKKVEVIDFPSDPRFSPNMHVVNIILQQYEYGGYTKIRDEQNLFSSADNNASIFTRLNHKKLSFDAYVGSSYSSSNHRTSDEYTLYKIDDINIGREQTADGGKYRSWAIPVSFRATYSTPKIQIANTIGYSFSKRPHQDEWGNLKLTRGEDVASYSFSSLNSSRENTLSYTGRFFFFLPSGWSLSVNPSFAYSHQNYTRVFSADLPSFQEVVTDARENAYNINLSATVRKYFNPSHSAYISLGANDLINRVDYSGTSEADVRLNTLRYFANMGYTFSLPSKFTLDLFATFSGSRIESNGNLNTEFLPSGGFSASWMPSAKSRFSLTGRVVQTTLGSYMVSDVLLRQNEYLFFKGNPDLKAFSNLYANLSYSYTPIEKLSLMAFVRYNAGYDLISTIYEPYPEEHALIQTTVNRGKYGILWAGTNITCSLLSNRLTVQLSPTFSHSRLEGFYSLSENKFSLSAQADFYAGDFNFSAYYQTQEYNLSPIPGMWTKNRSYYYLSAGWAKGAWNLSLRALNFFRQSYTGQFDRISSPIYSSYNVIDIPAYHAGVEVTAIFTFGYGKKVAKGNEVGRQWGAASAIQQ